MQTCLINGVASDYISVQDRGLQYGDGLFETIACTRRGLEFWLQHYQRLSAGAARLGISCPDENVWLDDIRRLLAESTGDCVIKLVLTRGRSERGYRADNTMSVTRLVFCMPGLPARFFSSADNTAATVCFCRQPVSINPALAGIKHLNRLENALARNEWQAQYTEGFMQDADGNIIEGTMSNLFAVRQGKLLTPSLLNSGVAGIIRARIIALAEQHAISLTVVQLTQADVLMMDELFICNSLLEILPVKVLVNGASNWRSEDFVMAEKINRLLQGDKAQYVQQL